MDAQIANANLHDLKNSTSYEKNPILLVSGPKGFTVCHLISIIQT